MTCITGINKEHKKQTVVDDMSIHSDLLIAFEQRNIGKFQEALEVFNADPNHIVKSRDKTIFEIALSTPGSSNFIKLCIENGADFYMVSCDLMIQLTCSHFISISIIFARLNKQL